jgi:hypothetical protein
LKIDASEFEGNVETLSENLERKLQRRIHVYHNMLEIDDNLSYSKIKDALKRVIHKLEPQRYHVVTESGSIKIRKLESHSHKARQKDGTPPSAPQTLPYFFPR